MNTNGDHSTPVLKLTMKCVHHHCVAYAFSGASFRHKYVPEDRRKKMTRLQTVKQLCAALELA